MHRESQAYSILRVKSVDDDLRTFSGTASTPSVDTQGDIVEPLGVSFTNPMPLLMFHDVQRPVGRVHLHPPTADGIEFTATIPKIADAGTLKDRVDEAWQSVKAGLIGGVSIRIAAPLEGVKKLPGGGLHWLKSRITELSLVTLPSNRDATIGVIKSLDAGHAAPGTVRVVTLTPPGDAGTATGSAHKGAPSMAKTNAEKKIAFDAEKSAKIAKLNELMAGDSETLDAAKQEQFDTLTEEIKTLDGHLARLETLESINKSAAKPVSGDTAAAAAASRAGEHVVISVKDNAAPGIPYARYAMCIAQAKGNRSEALEIAKARYPRETAMHDILKAAVAAGTTTDATWAGNLVQYQDYLGDFIDYLRPKTLLGKFGTGNIPSLNRVPFNVRIFSQTVGGSGYWVGEGKPKPLTKFGFGTVTLQWSKVANIAVLTQEEVRFSSPSAEAKVRDALAAALIERLDIDFIDPSKAAVANVSPASITNGIVATPPTGTDADHFRTDFATAMGGFISNNIDPQGIVVMMSATTALALSLMVNAFGQPEFPGLTMNGGTIIGFPVIVSQYLASYGSPSTGMVVIVSAPDVYLADDGQVVIDSSDQASLEMSDAPTQNGAAGTGASLVSLWQNNLLGLRAERFINWKLRRANAVAYLSPVAYHA